MVDLTLLIFVFGISGAATWYLCSPACSLKPIDSPNERSLHKVPTPRSGGLAIFLGWAVGTSALAPQLKEPSLLWLAPAILTLSAVSWLDDHRHVPPLWRLAVQVITAGSVLPAGLSLSALQFPGGEWPLVGPIAAIFSLAYVVWMTNLYNFMDGMDGLAAGMAVVGFGTLAALGALEDQWAYATLAATVAVAAGGFLTMNFPPARIFMGDLGSTLLGFLAAIFSLWADKLGIFPLWASVLLFSPFVVDATVTLFRRLITGERVWEAHRIHFYQRLVMSGLGQRKTLLWEYALMVVCALAAVWSTQVGTVGQWVILSAMIVIYGLAMQLVERRSGIVAAGE